MDEKKITIGFLETMEEGRTRYKNLKHLGLSHENAIKFANTKKGHWRISNSPILNTTLGNDYLMNSGFVFFSEYYRQVTV